MIDGVALIEETNPPLSTECEYGTNLGLPVIGPDGSSVPGHIYRDDMMNWNIGSFDPVGGDDNPCFLGSLLCNILDLWEFEELPCTGNTSSMSYSVRIVLDTISEVDSSSHAVLSSIMMGIDSIEYRFGPISSGEMYYIRFLGSDCQDVLEFQGVLDCDLCGYDISRSRI